LGASSTEQFFVSASRARESVTVYTDDKARLAEAIQSSGARMSAHELLKLPAARNIIDPFDAMLREKAIIPTSKKAYQPAKPEKEKDIEKKRMLSRRARQQMNQTYDVQISLRHRRGISM
jgi:hypothetical protein